MLTHTSAEAEEARIDAIITRVIDDLRGSATPEVDQVEPRRRFCIGVLTPLSSDPSNPTAIRRNRRTPESIGISARAQSEAKLITGTVDLELTLWFRLVPSFAEQSEFIGRSTQKRVPLKLRYAQHRVKISDLPFSVAVSAIKGRVQGDTRVANDLIAKALAAARVDIAQGPYRDRLYPGADKLEVTTDQMESEEAFQTATAGPPDLPYWRGTLNVDALQSSDGWRLGVTFSNSSPDRKQHQSEFFDTRLVVTLSTGRYVSREFHADRSDTRHQSRAWGRGINAVLQVDSTCKIATAETAPKFDQPRAGHRLSVDGTDVAALAGPDPIAELLRFRDELNAFGETWAAEAALIPDNLKRQTAEFDLARFRDEIGRFELGVQALRDDPRLLRSFQLANEVVRRHAAFKKWRPFQLGFIVAMMPSLIARENRDPKWLTELAKVDVVWFATGGGKSEATYGVILVALYYDRLRGKQRGMTAWLRYPLRMLSIQQLQRLMEFVVIAEEVRAEQKLEGDQFALGYYVGESNTPNRLTNARGLHDITAFKRRIDHLNGDSSFLRVLRRCPYRDCLKRDLKVLVDDSIERVRLEHVCNSCKRVAPIYISDAEIYRYLPAVVVGTVDRLARAGQTERFGHLYGQVNGKCRQHGYAQLGQCIEDGCKLTKKHFEPVESTYDPVPALLIQDELHLLKESLGTYDSHYEGFLDSFARRLGTGLTPKRLAATATIAGFERHVRELYGSDRLGRRFPMRGPSNERSAYVELDRERPINRRYIGIYPIGVTSDQVVARIAKAVHDLALEVAESDRRDSLDALYDLSLLYANTKDSLGNIGADLKPILNGTRSITGERSLEDVRQLIDDVESDAERPIEERIPAVISTSIVSHGVDIGRLNVMAFSGFPGKAADYIQSSSRVGRENMGVVFLVFDPTRNLDRSTYIHFAEYHERLYSLVQPVPVIRFSQSAVRRTFTGIFSATLLNTMGAEKRANFGPGRKAATLLAQDVPTEDEMFDSIHDAYGFDQLEPGVRSKYEAQARRSGRRARENVLHGEDWHTSSRLRPRPVPSLRETQEQIPFDTTPRRVREVTLYKEARR